MCDDDTRRLWFERMGEAYRVPSARTSDDSPLTPDTQSCDTPATRLRHVWVSVMPRALLHY